MQIGRDLLEANSVLGFRLRIVKNHVCYYIDLEKPIKHK